MIHRSFRYDLKPTAAQATRLRSWAGTVRFVYNLCFEQRRDFWRQYRRQTGGVITSMTQSREVTDLRSQVDWISDVPRAALEYALRDLDFAFRAFFSGRTEYPKPRVKGASESIRVRRADVSVRRLNAKWSALRLPKIGWVKFRDTRPIRGDIQNVTLVAGASGWSAIFTCEVEHEAPERLSASVGVDRGIANTLALSTGEQMSVPASLIAIERRHRRAQRSLRRKKRGSNRRRKHQQFCARLSARRARIRRDWLHRASINIAQRFGTVAMEDLNIRNMTKSAAGTLEEPGQMVRQKAGLNRSILNQGWNTFARLLAYKLEERGGSIVYVQPAHTSQTCSACGAVDPESRKSQAAFECIECGFSENADINAANNILRLGVGKAVKHTVSARGGIGRWPPCEARTASLDLPACNPAARAAGGC